MERQRRLRYRLQKLTRRRSRTFPMGTLLFYGPDEQHATKAVANILVSEDEHSDMRKWHGEADLREDLDVLEEVVAFFADHGIRSVATIDRIVGCPHEEGKDYEGATCPDPACSFWIGRNRWTGELE